VELAPGIVIPPAALRFQYARSGGPGGQNVNKVNTKAEVWVVVAALSGMTDATRSRLRTLAGSRLTVADEIHIAAESHRSQEKNRAEVLKRLRDLLIQAAREPRKRRKTRPTTGSRLRRLQTKRRRAGIKSNRQTGDPLDW
jgi:ribosome-associated protein